mmetsp:Transcript_21514/g.54242  ORF Transcript_21514/g.54242 Transcript_21514/m.54242 type:complete len:213 (+) Transcript_21514:2624-3262(+)
MQPRMYRSNHFHSTSILNPLRSGLSSVRTKHDLGMASTGTCSILLRCCSSWSFCASWKTMLSGVLSTPPEGPSMLAAGSPIPPLTAASAFWSRSLMSDRNSLKSISPDPSWSYLRKSWVSSFSVSLTSRSSSIFCSSRLSMTPELSLSILAKSACICEASSACVRPPRVARNCSCMRWRFSASCVAFCSANPWIRMAMNRLRSIQLPTTMIV